MTYKEYKEYKEFMITSNIGYENCQFFIEKILRNFDSKIIKNMQDIETIYCDFLVEGKFKVCLHYHDMAGLAIIALSKESEESARKIANYIERELLNERKDIGYKL